MDMEFIFMEMKNVKMMFIQVIGKKVNLREKVYIIIIGLNLREKYMMENIKIIKSMVMEFIITIEINTKMIYLQENTKKIKEMEKEYIILMMVKHMMGIGLLI